MLETRDLQPELMDDPALAERDHHAALSGLARINLISGSGRILWPAIEQIALQLKRSVRVLDIACGGGDVTRYLATRAQQSKLPISMTGADLSETALEFAREQTEAAGLKNLEFQQLNALEDEYPDDYDILCSSLFLHHLTENQARVFLRKQAEAAQCAVLVNDLRRSAWGYVMAKVGCRLLSRSPVVHFDGPQSVKAAFRLEEVRDLAAEVGMSHPRITTHWPQRYLMHWDQSQEGTSS